MELTPQQYELLCQQSKQCGLSKRVFLVRLIEGKPVKARPSQEIKVLRTEYPPHLETTSTEIARSVINRPAFAKAEDAKRGLYLLDQVYELLYEVAKK